MRYFKIKIIVDEFTTKRFDYMNTEKHYNYDEIDGYEYVGLDDENTDYILSQQLPELEITELSFSEIEPILEDCQKMKDLDLIIETAIAKKYSLGKELKMRDLPDGDEHRKQYEDFKEMIKGPIRQMKKDYGLRE